MDCRRILVKQITYKSPNCFVVNAGVRLTDMFSKEFNHMERMLFAELQRTLPVLEVLIAVLRQGWLDIDSSNIKTKASTGRPKVGRRGQLP